MISSWNLFVLPLVTSLISPTCSLKLNLPSIPNPVHLQGEGRQQGEPHPHLALLLTADVLRLIHNLLSTHPPVLPLVSTSPTRTSLATCGVTSQRL